MSRALEGVRVVDLTHGAFAYAPYLLAAHAAEIISVGAARGRSYERWDSLGPSAEERRRDLERAEIRGELAGLLRSADVVVETFPPGHLHQRGLDWVDLERECPRLVWASITPFGCTGPRRDWRSSNLIAYAVAGVLGAIGDPDRAPLVPGGPIPLAEILASAHASAGVLLALRARRRSGRGQRVDVSTQATTVAASSELGAAVFLDDLIPRRRGGNRRRQLAPSGLYPCRDGFAAVMIVPAAHWDALARWIQEKTGNDAVVDPMFRDLGIRVENAELLESWVEELTTQYTKQELFELGQRRGISITPVNELGDLLEDPHLAARGWWREETAADGERIRLAGPPYRFRRDG